MANPFAKSDSVTIHTLRITSADGSRVAELTPQCSQFSIYEDIMFPVIRGEFEIVDGVDLLNSFPIIGEEIIIVEFSSQGQDDLISHYRLHVKAIENQVINVQGKSKTYTITAVSEEFITNATQNIATRVNGNSTDIIASLLSTQLNSKKAFNAPDGSRGVVDVLLSRIRPLQAIDLIRSRAVSAKYMSSSYVFFENKYGFTFASIEWLMDQLKDNVRDKVFYYDTTGNSDARNNTTRNILSLRNVSQVNNTNKLASGSMNTMIRKFDIMTGQTETITYKNSEQQSKFKGTQDMPIGLNSTSFEQIHGANTAVSLLVPHSSERSDTFIADSLGPKRSFIAKIAQNIWHAYVNGDTALTAGDCIEIHVPEAHGATTGNGDSRLAAGKYLIAKIRHIVVMVSAMQGSYTASMELIRGSYGDNV